MPAISPSQRDARASVESENYVRRAEMRVADALGRLMEFWGFKRNMGRVWTVLFLAPEPVDAASLAETLGLSPSAVSMALGQLGRWGAVKKSWVPGERRDHYVAETRVRRLVKGVVQGRELPMVRDAQEAFEEADRWLRSAPASKVVAFKRRRLAYLRVLANVGERLVQAFFAGQPIDPSELAAVPDCDADTAPEEELP